MNFTFHPNQTTLKVIFSLVLAFSTLVASSQTTITSAASGGHWSNNTTWVGGVPPASGDHVIINSLVYVNGNYTCNNLTVTTGGTLYNTYAIHANLAVNGNVVNNGVVSSNPLGFDFQVFLYGNFTNNGNWNLSTTTFSGTSNHTLQAAAGKKLEGYLVMSDSIGDILLGSNFQISGNTWELNKTTLKTNSYNLIASACHISNGYIQSNDTLHLDGSSVANIRISGNYKLNGNIQLQINNKFSGTATNLDTLFNQYGFHPTLSINGTIINNGAIITNPAGFSLTIDLDGNIENNGVWAPASLVISGTANHTFKAAKGKAFEGPIAFTDSIGELILTSEVLLKGSYLNLAKTKIRTNGFTLISNSRHIYNGYIIANDTIILENSSIEDMIFFGNYFLGGNIYIRHNNILNDNSTILDTLFNQYAYHATLTVKGNLINKGTIKNNPDGFDFYLAISGNVTNQGIWNVTTTYLNGTTNQILSQSLGKKFEGPINTTDTLGDMLLGSDIALESSTWNFNNATLRTNGHQLYANNYMLKSGKFISNETSILDNTSLLGMKFYGNYNLGGNIFLQSGNVLNDTAIISDTLFNQYAWHSTLEIKGLIINKGTIKSNPSGFSLSLDVSGNIQNEGLWSPSATYLSGATHQQLSQTKGMKFEGSFTTTDTTGEIRLGTNVMFESNNWNFNGAILKTNGYTLYSTNYTFKNARFNSNDTLILNDSYIDNCSFWGNFFLGGNLYVQDNNVFNGNTTILDTLMNRYAFSPMLTINGSLINDGTVISNPSGFSLYIKIKGDLTNNKILNISNLYLFGTNPRTIAGTNAKGIQASVYVDDSIRLTGTNTLPSLSFTANPLARCTIDSGASLALSTISNPSKVINRGRISLTQLFNNTVPNTLTFYDATLNFKAGVAMNTLIVDHYGFQQHPTATGGISCWWRLRNSPQNFTDTLNWLKLNYRAESLNGNLEDSLKAFFSANAGLTWKSITSGVTIDKANKTITILKAPSYGHYLVSSKALGITTFQPMIETLEPRSGGNTGYVTIYIFGAGLKSNSIVKLKLIGQSDIIADTSYVTDYLGESMLARFNLKGKNVGVYDVVIETPGEASITKPSYFTIVNGLRSKPWAAITGRDRFLLNRWQTFNLSFGNTANSDALGTVLVFVVSDLPGLSVRFPDIKFVLPKTISSLGKDYTRLVDSASLYYVSDSLTGFAGERMRIYPFYLPLIAAGSSNDARVQIILNGTGALKMSAWVIDPFWENINYGSESTEPMPMEVRACITFQTEKFALQQLTGGLPVLGCIGVVDKLFPPDNYLPDYMIPEEKPYTWGSFLWDFASAGVSMGQCVTGFLPGVGTAVSYGLSVAGAIIDFKENYSVNEGCWLKFHKISQSKKNSTGVNSLDPNEIVGPQGFTSQNYISAKGNKNYSIYFENKATATSSALEVFVKDTLDRTKFDLNTFSFNAVTFGDTTIKIQEYAKKFTVLVDMYPKKNIIVQVHGTLDTLTGAIAWSFYSLDRTTLELTEDPDLGFLPPNKISPEGEGNVTFSCKLINKIAHNAVVSNKASIVFDLNAPIVTNTHTNKIDTMVPVSSVIPLAAKQTDSSFMVSWGGSDQGCGILEYNIFVSTNDSAFVLWKSSTSSTAALFKGRNGKKYKFFSIASDSLGLTEKQKVTAEATTQISMGIENSEAPISKFELYPNPANDAVELVVTLLNAEDLSIEITDISGRRLMLVKTNELQAGKNVQHLDVNKLDNGIYLVTVYSKNSKLEKKLAIYR